MNSDDIAGGIVTIGILMLYIGLPLCVMTFIAEYTKWGRKFMDKVMFWMKIPEDFDDE